METGSEFAWKGLDDLEQVKKTYRTYARVFSPKHMLICCNIVYGAKNAAFYS